MKIVRNTLMFVLLLMAFSSCVDKEVSDIKGYWFSEENQFSVIIEENHIQVCYVNEVYKSYRYRSIDKNIITIDSPQIMRIKYLDLDRLYFYKNDFGNIHYDNYIANNSFVNIYDNKFNNQWDSLKVNFLIHIDGKTHGKRFELILLKSGNAKFAKGNTIIGYPKLKKCVLDEKFEDISMELSKISNSNYNLWNGQIEDHLSLFSVELYCENETIFKTGYFLPLIFPKLKKFMENPDKYLNCKE